MTAPKRPRSSNRRTTSKTSGISVPQVVTETVQEINPTIPPTHPPTEPSKPLKRRSLNLNKKSRLWFLGSALVFIALLATSWFALPIRSIQVSGQKQLSENQIKNLAKASVGSGWLYYTKNKAKHLLSSPWVKSATITKRFPDILNIVVMERTPLARWQTTDGKFMAVSADGMVMPNVQGLEKLPLIKGWGPDRYLEAIRLIQSLNKYNVQSVTYTPAGLSIKLPSGTIWTGDPQFLFKYAGSISMYKDKNISIYPWGVSVRE